MLKVQTLARENPGIAVGAGRYLYIGLLPCCRDLDCGSVVYILVLEYQPTAGRRIDKAAAARFINAALNEKIPSTSFGGASQASTTPSAAAGAAAGSSSVPKSEAGATKPLKKKKPATAPVDATINEDKEDDAVLKTKKKSTAIEAITQSSINPDGSGQKKKKKKKNKQQSPSLPSPQHAINSNTDNAAKDKAENVNKPTTKILVPADTARPEAKKAKKEKSGDGNNNVGDGAKPVAAVTTKDAVTPDGSLIKKKKKKKKKTSGVPVPTPVE